MKSALDWIKSNIIADISIIIVILSLGFLGYVMMKGGEFRASVQDRDRALRDLDGYMQKQVEVPSEDPNLPPVIIPNVTINGPVIDVMNDIRQKMDSEATRTFELVMEVNQGGHRLLMEGMLPSPTDRFKFRDEYLKTFLPMLLAPYDQNAPVVGANAGLPPDDLLIQEKLDKIFEQFSPSSDQGMQNLSQPQEQPATGRRGRLADPEAAAELGRRGRGAVQQPFMEQGYTPGGRGTSFSAEHLTASDRDQLRTTLRNEVQSLLQERAKSLHLYADTRMWLVDTNGNATFNANYPLDVAAWALDPTGRAPTPSEIYESQLEYWIQQDIIHAIALANGVDDPDASILTAPIKRLIKLDVLPGYVGLHSGGGVDTSTDSSSGAGAGWRPPTSAAAPAAGAGAEVLLYPPPPAGAIGSADQPLSDNFYISPTGHVSNALYDVRHVKLDVVVDATKLDEFYNAINKVNLMTVLDATFQDVNEYTALREGRFFYTGDAVRATFIIETVWLREWTKQYMPEKTQQYLGIVAAPGGAAPGPGMGQPGGYLY